MVWRVFTTPMQLMQTQMQQRDQETVERERNSFPPKTAPFLRRGEASVTTRIKEHSIISGAHVCRSGLAFWVVITEISTGSRLKGLTRGWGFRSIVAEYSIASGVHGCCSGLAFSVLFTEISIVSGLKRPTRDWGFRSIFPFFYMFRQSCHPPFPTAADRRVGRAQDL